MTAGNPFMKFIEFGVERGILSKKGMIFYKETDL